MKDPTDYDEAYAGTPDLFGPSPEPTLVEFWELLDRSRPVLDIGCGQGRNALFLSRQGISVHALDPSEVAVKTVALAAARENLPVETTHGSFGDLEDGRTPYSGILLFGLLPILEWAAIHRLTRLLWDRSAPGALLWVTGFTTADPAFARHRKNWSSAGRNHFVGPGGEVRTFLEEGELLGLLRGWGVLHHWEGRGPQHRHGDGPVHRHDLVEGVFKRP